MKNTFGNSITVTLFGESHGEYIGAVLDGLAPGIRIDHEYIKARLALRRPSGKISTARVEADEYSIVSGACDGYTQAALHIVEMSISRATAYEVPCMRSILERYIIVSKY